MTEIRIPQLGVNEDRVLLVDWQVKDGDRVRRGDVVCLVETDKAAQEVEAPADGVLRVNRKLGTENVPIQALIGVIVSDGDIAVTEGLFSDAPEAGRVNKHAGFQPSTAARKPAPDATDLARPTFSPKALRLMRERGLPEAMFAGRRFVKESDVAGVHAPSEKAGGPLAIWGAGIGGQNAAECARMAGFVLKYFIDIRAVEGSQLMGVPVLNEVDETLFQSEGVRVFIGIASGQLRRSLRDKNKNLEFVSLTHPHAFVSPTATVGVNSFIKAGAVIDSEVSIGDDTVVDNGVIVAHNCTIGPGVHLAPGASLGGCVTIGDYTVVGVGASIAPDLVVGQNVIVNSGAVVVDNLAEGFIYSGNPAKRTGRVKGSR